MNINSAQQKSRQCQIKENNHKIYEDSKQKQCSNFAQIDAEFRQAMKSIELLANDCSKSMQLRIKEWINKLESVSGVLPWKKDRNLYAKVLLIMIKKHSLTFPFDKRPPESCLPTLALYEVSFDIRKQLESENYHQGLNGKKDYTSDPNKQNLNWSNYENNITTDKSYQYLNKHRSKQKYSLQNKIVQINLTELKDIKKKEEKAEEESLGQQIKQLMKSCYDFLSQNMERVDSKQEADELLESIWSFSHFNAGQ